jgi:RNA polymerase sigma-70 factor (ECF subfamily)
MEPSDHECVEEIAAGRTERLELLVTRHASALRAYLKLLSADPHLAEDVLQETFIEVLTSAGRYDRRASFRSWLFGIARNLSFARARRGRKEREGPSELEALLASGGGPPQPDVRAEEREEAEGLLSALGSLPEREREVLTLKFLEEWSYADIASLVGAPESTVKTRASAGLRRLRASLGR